MPSRSYRSVLSLGFAALLLGLAACNDGPACADCDTGADPDALGRILLEPCGYDFGDVDIATVASTSVKASNLGLGTAEVTSLTATAPFSVGATTPVSVIGGSSYQFSLRFEPTDYGVFQSELVLDLDNATTDQVVCVVSGRVLSDQDGDGYDSVAAGGRDCDDTDASINPGAIEIWYDGFDQDCDGASDYDQDGDGFESDVFNELQSTGGGDCVDVDPDIRPDAEDEWYDGVDSDCDGSSDYDKDGDTYLAAEYGGSDCDDDDRDVNPESYEGFNGLDDDCDGDIDEDSRSDRASITLFGAAARTEAGAAVAVGDFDADGLADIVVGASASGGGLGTVYLFADEGWLDGDDMGDADHSFGGEGTGSAAFGGDLVNVGDFTGDGVDDLLVGSAGYSASTGRVYLFSGTTVGAATAADAELTITGEEDYGLGAAVAGGFDLDGDGLTDLAAYGRNTQIVYDYMVLQYGGGSGDLTWTTADASWKIRCGTLASTPTNPSRCGPRDHAYGGSESFPNSAHYPGDLDGDGYDDLVLGDAGWDTAQTNAGKVWVIWGRPAPYVATGTSPDGSATSLATGTHNDALVGSEIGVVPDLDGDGDDELFILEGESKVLYYVPGDPSLVAGGLDLAVDAEAAIDGRLLGGDIDDVTPIGDWSGDGVPEFAFSVGDDIGHRGGQVFVFDGQPLSGAVDPLNQAYARINGATDRDGDGEDDGVRFGENLPRIPGDIDGDGDIDMVAADPGIDGGTGEVYLFENSRL